MNQSHESLVEVIHKNGIRTYEKYDSIGRFVAYFGMHKPDNIGITMTIDKRALDPGHRFDGVCTSKP